MTESTPPTGNGEEAAYIEQILGRDGLLARAWEGFRWREGQIMGAYPIDGAIRSRTRVLIEAPTGTGKTLMYLVPAIYHATRHGRRVLVVTANLTLQRQLIEKDLPRLAKVLPWPFRYGELKGRQNFLCRKRAQDERYAPTSWQTEPERQQVAMLLDWEKTDEHGDKMRLPVALQRSVDQRLFVRSEDCERERCAFFGNDEDRDANTPRCFAESARARAFSAQILVTNYAMLCMHLRGYAQVLPTFDIAILDEAHVAADIARERFGFDMRPGVFARAVSLLAKEDEDLRADDSVIEAPSEAPVSEANDNGMPDEEFFEQVAQLVAPPDEDLAAVDPETLGKSIIDRGQKFFLRLSDLRENAPIALPNVDFDPNWRTLVDQLQRAARLYGYKADRLSPNDARARALAKRYDRSAQHCTALAARIEGAMTLADPDRFCYFVSDDEDKLALSQRALRVDEWFRARLFTVGRTVIMTSATLRTNGSFAHVCQEFGLEEKNVTTGFLPTPFDMMTQARLIVPAPDNRRMPSPVEPGFDAMVVRMVRRAIQLACGRTMALFTSRKRLRYVADNLGDVGYRVLVQGDMERGALLAEFQNDIDSVLLATGSFWAGVDVPGESLSCLVIDKLPFEADDPLSQAIKAQLLKQNLSPFQHWAMPRAILTLKQGLGRLIRTTDDRGVMVVLDTRLTQKSYGAQFLRSLDVPASCIVYRSDVISEFLQAAASAAEPRGD